MQSHEELLPRADRGCLAISDVSGYTEYLRDAELEHAQDVLTDLTQTVVDHLTPPLRLSKLEGDAAFAYATEDEIEASMLLDSIDETYFAFRGRVRDIHNATSCECNACVLIPRLNLKFVVHHGRFVRQHVAGGEELAGPDIILVHRLLKNRVRDALGVDGYALFTRECVEALGIDPDALEMRKHREEVEDGREVVGYVEDLERRWRFEDERRRVFVAPAEAEFEDAAVLPGHPPVVWEYLTNPKKRPLWQQEISRIDEDNPAGRRGAGTTNHCVHGSNVVVQEVLDWRPFRYFTLRTKFPLVGWWTWTFELRPTDDGQTELRVRPERLRRKQRIPWRMFRPRMKRGGRRNMGRLRALLEEEASPAHRSVPAG